MAQTRDIKRRIKSITNTKKISQVVAFELEGHIPFQIENVFWDHHVLNQEDNQSNILCTYTYEENVSKYLDCLTSVNVDAKYLGADIADMAGIAQVAVLPSEGFYAICDIGHTKTNLLIMKGKELKYARTIGIGGHHFTRAIQRIFNLNYEKAEALKISRGKLFIREQDSDQVSRILSKVADELVSSMKQTFMGASKYYNNLTLPAIYCCGGGTRLVGIIEHLAFHLRTNVFELEALTLTNHHFEDPDEVNRVIPQVLSTAIRPIYLNRVPRINFRKGPFAFKQDLQVITKELKSIGVFFVLIFMLGIVYYFFADHHYSGKIGQINKKVADTIKKEYKEIQIAKSPKRGSKKKRRKLKGYLNSVNSKIKEFEEVASDGGSSENVLQIMQEISTRLPSKQEVNFETKEFVFADNFLRLSATTNDTLNVEKIVEALKKSEMFADITSTDAQPKPGGTWDFTLKIDIKKMAGTSE